MDGWDRHPTGRGRLNRRGAENEATTTILGSLPPSKDLCSTCWSAGHWRRDCMANGLAYNMYEPALVVLQPKEKVRKYFPCRNIVVEKSGKRTRATSTSQSVGYQRKCINIWKTRNGQYLGTVEHPPTPGGPQPMEVNRVQDKGKGWKGKGHGKRKESLWQNIWSIGSHASWKRI